MSSIHLPSFTATSCLGHGTSAHLAALRIQSSGLIPCQFETALDLKTYIGEVKGVNGVVLPKLLSAFDCRNNRLAWLGLQQDGFDIAVEATIARYGKQRVGVFIGTSTSGMLHTEQAYRNRDATGALPGAFTYKSTHNNYSVADFVREAFKLEGPAAVISTACSSSAKVFAAAARMLEVGLIDAAVVGGVDSLCLTSLYGFSSLELLSTTPCRPYDVERCGISIGEAAVFALLERPAANLSSTAILMLGAGESSDAYHMSSPHPEGLGAYLAMQAALKDAGLQAEDIDYINLHGTATPSNDAAEGKAVAALFGNRVPCSSTKGATGHTLGAAGALEVVISALALQNGFLPGSTNTYMPDPQIPIQYITENLDITPQRILSNSFGFGGSNCSLVLGKAS